MLPPAAAPLSSGVSRNGALNSSAYASYESLIKDVLRRRLLRMYTLQLVATHFILSALLVTSSSGLISSLRPTIVLLSVVVYVAAVLPLFVLLKWNLSQPGTQPACWSFLGFSPPFGSRGAYAIEALQSSRTQINLAAYVVSGALLAIGHATALWLYSPETSSAWSPYIIVKVGPRGGPFSTVTRPNERIFALVSLNAIFGLVYAITRTALRPRRPLPPFQTSPFHIGISQRVSTAVKRRILPALLLGLAASTVEFSIYLFIRRPFFRALLRLVGAQSSLRPLLIPSFATPFLSQSPGLATQLSSLAAASAVTWELACVLWDVYSSQPVNVSAYAKGQVRCLIGGLAARRGNIGTPSARAVQEYYSHFAFAELSHLSNVDEAWRRALWKDVGDVPSGALADGSAWANIATECLSVLESEGELVVRRGKPVAPAAGSASAVVATPSAKPRISSTGAKHDVLVPNQTVVRAPAPSLWEKLISAGSISPTASSTAPAAPPRPSNTSAGSSTAVQSAMLQNRDPNLNQLLHRLAPSAPDNTPGVPQKSNSAQEQTASPATPSQQANPLAAAFASVISTAFAASKSLFHLLPATQRDLILGYLPSSAAWETSNVVLLDSLVPASPALSAWAAHAATSLLSFSVTEDVYGSVSLAGASHTRAGSEEIIAACAQLLKDLNQWQREAEAEAVAADQAANRSEKRASPKAGARSSAESTLPVGPSALDHAQQRVALAWSKNAAPLQQTLRNGLRQVLNTYEAHGVTISPRMRSALHQALAT
ncbi:Nucleoporin protein Ndc1-Nup [Ceraceosorus bombacis]|uniref:Nucleoporin protein Ndc1-Nup n=1 Tax=Ceraceosorus bombacis TaxID=401625 RepID=A0A0P1BP50_9BASI|nr:Nucleoporin protein Ndc1-Nup [Ceraceosorus bombacis]